MQKHQSGVIEPIPHHAVYLEFLSPQPESAASALTRLAGLGERGYVVGLSAAFSAALSVSPGREGGACRAGVRDFQPYLGADGAVMAPATQASLFIQARGDDPEAARRAETAVRDALGDAFAPVRRIEAFRFADTRDLTGYKDGTENPTDEAALQAALADDDDAPGLAGGAVLAVQKWIHDLAYFQSLGVDDQNAVFGRRIADDSEIDDAHPSAHARRTAQESFEPEAFMVRRSMMWRDAAAAGMIFTSFARSVYPFDVQMRRMCGLEDGIVDRIFSYSRPVSGAFYWCPPIRGGALDLRAVGL